MSNPTPKHLHIIHKNSLHRILFLLVSHIVLFLILGCLSFPSTELHEPVEEYSPPVTVQKELSDSLVDTNQEMTEDTILQEPSVTTDDNSKANELQNDQEVVEYSITATEMHSDILTIAKPESSNPATQRDDSNTNQSIQAEGEQKIIDEMTENSDYEETIEESEPVTSPQSVENPDSNTVIHTSEPKNSTDQNLEASTINSQNGKVGESQDDSQNGSSRKVLSDKSVSQDLEEDIKGNLSSTHQISGSKLNGRTMVSYGLLGTLLLGLIVAATIIIARRKTTRNEIPETDKAKNGDAITDDSQNQIIGEIISILDKSQLNLPNATFFAQLILSYRQEHSSNNDSELHEITSAICTYFGLSPVEISRLKTTIFENKYVIRSFDDVPLNSLPRQDINAMIILFLLFLVARNHLSTSEATFIATAFNRVEPESDLINRITEEFQIVQVSIDDKKDSLAFKLPAIIQALSSKANDLGSEWNTLVIDIIRDFSIENNR